MNLINLSRKYGELKGVFMSQIWNYWRIAMLSNILSSSRSIASLFLHVNKLKVKLGLLFNSSRLNLFQIIFSSTTCSNQFEYRKAPELYKPRKWLLVTCNSYLACLIILFIVDYAQQSWLFIWYLFSKGLWHVSIREKIRITAY